MQINIGGITPLSTIDYPGRLAAVVYTQGCNFRCLYCHNYRLVEKRETPFTQDQLKTFLEARRRIIDGVVISGGEPTIHKGLPSFCAWLKEMGFAVKLDTNGTNHLMLRLLIERQLVDFIAMDIKAPWEKYARVIQRDFPVEIIKECLQLIKESGIACEFRTTVHSALLSLEDLKKIIDIVGPGYSLVFQICNPTPRYNVQNTYTKEGLLSFIKNHGLKFCFLK